MAETKANRQSKGQDDQFNAKDLLVIASFVSIPLLLLSGIIYVAHKDSEQVYRARFVPKPDSSEPVKHANAMHRNVLDDKLHFLVAVVSTLRHPSDHEVTLKYVKVEAFHEDSNVGFASTNKTMFPQWDSIHTDYHRHHVKIVAEAGIIFSKGDTRFDKCTSPLPYTLPLRLHFTVEYRSENEKGEVVEGVKEYDESVEVCCDCEEMEEIEN